MRRRDISEDQIRAWIEDADKEYEGRYTEQYRTYFKGLKPDDDCQPAKALTAIKKSDPKYRQFIECLLAQRNIRLGVEACA